MKKFEHKTVMRCKKCGAEFYSRYSGEFRVCDCWHTSPNEDGGCAIDETEHYCRWIGQDFEIRNREGEFHVPKLVALREKD